MSPAPARSEAVPAVRGMPMELPAEPLQELFRRRAARSPRAPAVEGGDARLSYGDLDARSDALARGLRHAGVSEGDVVAVQLPSGAGFVTAVLAALKAGAAFMPLDPGQPAARSRLQLERTRARLVVTAPGQERPDGAPAALLDELAARGAAAPPPAPPRTGPASTAYVMFTSGSTGEPKGVAVPHRALVNRLVWGQSVYPLRSGDRVLWATRPVFDFSLWELFAPLLHGACAVTAEQEATLEAAALTELVDAERVTALHLVPTLLARALDSADLTACRTLRYTFVGGDALPPDVARAAAGTLPGAVFNQYGPTEACIDVTCWPVDPQRVGDRTPIGSAIANTVLYVLDDDRQPVPAGQAGELYVGGACLADGYVADPDQTAARFAPAPDGSGERLYRTGDLVACGEDGLLRFLGRVDDQVQVNGVRVEPAEVEIVLSRHPAVRRAGVTLSADRDAGDELVAAVELGDPSVTDEDLRRFVRASLPGPLVPASVVRLDALPSTPAGKLDRRRLPEVVAAARATRGRAAQPAAPPGDGPGGDVRSRVEELWCGLLGEDARDPDANFFDFGGHSLLGARLASAIRRELGVRVPLRDLFRDPTLRKLCELAGAPIDDAPAAAGVAAPAGVHAVTLNEAGGAPPLYLPYTLGGSVSSYRDLAAGLSLPAVGLAAGGDVPEAPSVEDVAAACVRALRVHRGDGPVALGGWSFGGVVAYEAAQQLRQAGEDVPVTVLIDSVPPECLSGELAETAPAALLLHDLSELLGRELGLPPGAGSDRAAAEADRLLELLDDPEERDLATLLLRRYRAHSDALRRYRPAPWRGGRLLVVRARSASPGADPWQSYAPQGLDLRHVDASHMTILRPPAVRAVAAHVDEVLRDAV